jgi:hypothetical protein
VGLAIVVSVMTDEGFRIKWTYQSSQDRNIPIIPLDTGSDVLQLQALGSLIQGIPVVFDPAVGVGECVFKGNRNLKVLDGGLD